jgi:hypothetical protein
MARRAMAHRGARRSGGGDIAFPGGSRCGGIAHGARNSGVFTRLATRHPGDGERMDAPCESRPANFAGWNLPRRSSASLRPGFNRYPRMLRTS